MLGNLFKRIGKEPDYDLIREYVEKNFEKEKRKRRIGLWAATLFIFVVMSVVAWGVAVSNGGLDGRLLVPLLILTIAGGLSVFLNGLAAYLEGEAGDRQIRRDLVMKAKWQQTFGLLDRNTEDIIEGRPVEKAKRDSMMSLSDDGELVPDRDTEPVRRRQASDKS
jgi:hypothetical protein